MTHPQLRAAIQQWVALEKTQWTELAAIFHQRSVAAGTHLLLPGSHSHELVFVCSGLLRFYYLTEQGGEANKAFIAEGAFAGPLASSVLNLPVIYGAQALEPSVLLVASYSAFSALFDRHPVFDRLGRKLAEYLLVGKELRMRTLLLHQAKDRYLAFVNQYPDLIERIPQYHIAGYLGITEVSLSRLKGDLRRAQMVIG
ncbi:Crp/Fnr family transcriptional regulator [Herpetosiphon geysericola]|uniref:Crp/Fnr family transcriptional regulator n=1 Tax=Herpetosiphon geysericola TaxID=70996 RepID=UPI0006C908D0|nr:Crp/Fnr family transcriptional regulator [Herpetosiphon geysericola]